MENKKEKSSPYVISTIILVLSFFIPIIKYVVDTDIGYYIEYGNVRDFFIIVSEVALNVLFGITFGFGIVLLINLFSKKSCFNFLINNKKLVIIGLVSSILVIILPIISAFVGDLIEIVKEEYYYDKSELVLNLLEYVFGCCVNNYLYVGLIVYFSIILNRMNGKKTNIKFANFLLIGFFILYAVNDNAYNVILDLIIMVIDILSIIYLINILLKKRLFISNKIFALGMIGRELINIINMFDSVSYVNFLYETLSIVRILSRMLVIPYFYNYYKLLKGEKKNV